MKKIMTLMLSCLLLLGMTGVVWAEEIEGEAGPEKLTVEVYCSSGGAAVSGAAVTVINEMTGAETKLPVTDESGLTSMTFTEAGEYAVKCECNGELSDYVSGIDVIEVGGKLMLPDGSTRIELKAKPIDGPVPDDPVVPTPKPAPKPAAKSTGGSAGTAVAVADADSDGEGEIVEIEESETPKAAPAEKETSGPNMRAVILGAFAMFMIAFGLMRRRD